MQAGRRLTELGPPGSAVRGTHDHACTAGGTHTHAGEPAEPRLCQGRYVLGELARQAGLMRGGDGVQLSPPGVPMRPSACQRSRSLSGGLRRTPSSAFSQRSAVGGLNEGVGRSPRCRHTSVSAEDASAGCLLVIVLLLLGTLLSTSSAFWSIYLVARCCANPKRMA